MKIEELIDRSKGGYAIEMEVMGGYDYDNHNIDKETKKFIKNEINKAEKKHNAKMKPLRTHTESRNIREYTIETNNIKAKSDVYLAVGKYTKNNTHSPIGSNSFFSGGTHLHIFLTKEGFKYVQDNFLEIYSRLLSTQLYCKINYKNGRPHLFHRERRGTFNAILEVMKGQILYGKSRGMALSRDFQSIEFRANNVIHPFQFLYFLAILNIKKSLYTMKGNINTIEGNMKYQYSQLPKQISILRHSENINMGNINNSISDIMNNIPQSMIADPYWIRIIKDYLRTTGMKTKHGDLFTYDRIIRRLKPLHTKAKDDQSKQSRTGAGVIKPDSKLPSSIINELSSSSQTQDGTSV